METIGWKKCSLKIWRMTSGAVSNLSSWSECWFLTLLCNSAASFRNRIEKSHAVVSFKGYFLEGWTYKKSFSSFLIKNLFFAPLKINIVPLHFDMCLFFIWKGSCLKFIFIVNWAQQTASLCLVMQLRRNSSQRRVIVQNVWVCCVYVLV